MAIPSTPDRDFRTPRHAAATPEEPARAADRGAAPWLWALLILLLMAVPAWWWVRNSRESPEVVTPPGNAPAAQVMPAPAEPRKPSMVATREPRPAQAPVIRNREARPARGNAMPAYPPRALRAGLQGSVTARIQVDARGAVSDVAIIERRGARERDLDRAVIDAVRKWHFEPALRDGQAVVSTVQLPVEFKAAQ